MGRLAPRCGRLPAALVALFLVASSGAEVCALERMVAPEPRLGAGEEWRSSTQATVSYYNLCTGWSWVWDYRFFLDDSWGVQFDAPDGATTLIGHWEFLAYGTTSYPYAGTVHLMEITEDGQVGAQLAMLPYSPSPGWFWYQWDVPLPESGRVLVTARGPVAGGYKPGLVTEDPGTGPDGAGPACGACYPVGRETRSRFSFTSATPWPGQRFNKGDACDAELVWDAVFAGSPTSAGDGIESMSWSRLRAMYR